MTIAIGKIFNSLISHIYPIKCVFCHHKSDEALCFNCKKKLPFISQRDDICKICLNYIEDKHLKCCDAVVTAFSITHRASMIYEVLSKKLIQKFKYNDSLYLVRTFGKMLVDVGNDILMNADAICYVPIHRSKYLSRNYNQSEKLAEVVSNLTKKPILHALKKTNHSRRQATLNFSQRLSLNLEQYQCNCPSVSDKQIVLVDDVCTTGGTLNACTEALHMSGAKSVSWLTLATTINKTCQKLNDSTDR